MRLDRHSLFNKVICLSLAIIHIVTVGPVKDALAFTTQSESYKLTAGALTEGGSSRGATSIKIWQDAIGEPLIGGFQCAAYQLNTGFIPAILPAPPLLTQKIPYQSWVMNSSKESAFDLDDYFSSPDGYALAFTVSGNSQINVNIDPATHVVSFSQSPDFSGVEEIYFFASDTQYNITKSNKVSLQVENTIGPDKPVIVDIQVEPAEIRENDLVMLTIKAIDLDNDDINFSYSDFFSEVRKYKEGDYWISEATWQTSDNDRGHYNVTVTAQDTTHRTDSGLVLINVGNSNRPPTLDPISDITVQEGGLVRVMPVAQDPDGDAITFYYSTPLDEKGLWLTDYHNAGTYFAQVIASDGINSVSQSVKIIVNNTNQGPLAVLTLNKYTLVPNEQLIIDLYAYDPDQDVMTFEIKKDAEVIASGTIVDIITTVTTSFADEGDYQISAKVTDSGGLEAADSKDIQVTVRNQYLLPVMGDFNGDGLTDLGLRDVNTGDWDISLSRSGTFEAATTWLSGFGASTDWVTVGGDFNGDGKTDIGIYNSATGELKVAVSTGLSFTDPRTWVISPYTGSSWKPFAGNFDLNKYTDIAIYNKDTGEVRVALNGGEPFNFMAFNRWFNNGDIDYIPFVGDFNGDSLTDLCLFKKATGEFKVALSNSSWFVPPSVWITGFATNMDPLIADFNSDGLTDIGYWNKLVFPSGWWYAISTGSSFLDKGLWLDSFGTSANELAATGDFNGDGVTDAAIFESDELGIGHWRTRNFTDKRPDLLVEIDNGMGGKTEVTYNYASSLENNAVPFPVYVATSISLIDTLPIGQPQETYRQDVTYSGGYYNADERQFLGFATSRVTDPVTGNYTETHFYQGKPGEDGALRGQIERIVAYDGKGRLVSQIKNVYDVKKGGPDIVGYDGSRTPSVGYPSLKEQTTTVWEENTASVSAMDKFTYDNIGNLLDKTSEGDLSKTGDEKSVVTTYAPGYEIGFNRPMKTIQKDRDGNTVSQKSFEYDNRGNLTKETILITNPLTAQEENAVTHLTYDGFGNPTQATNSLGNVAAFDIESTFYTFTEKVTNPLGQTITYVYDPRFGVVNTATDQNGNTSTTTYDSLGRIIKGENALGLLATYIYPDFNTKVTIQGGLIKTEYIDGLKRLYKTISSGEDGTRSRYVVSETFYNERGLTAHESLPHYVDESLSQISYLRYEYDGRGRIVKTLADFPGILNDSEGVINYITPLYTEIIDPQGHKKGYKKDVYENRVEVVEFTQEGAYRTSYEYDIQKNLTKVTDHQGNITQIFYDSIGRKIKMVDPDMGQWLYEYDFANNLTKTVDAKGQVLIFEYDKLNRLAKKYTVEGLENIELASYFYDDVSKSNCIGKLSKVIDGSGSTEYFYDALGRQIKSIKTIDGAPYVVEETYDILNRLQVLKYPDGEIVYYTYDMNSGLLEKVEGSTQEGPRSYVKNITYNAQGQIVNIEYGNASQTNYTYGQDLRLSRILTRSAGSTLQDLNYAFDKNGNLATLTDNLRSDIRAFTYDDLDHLICAENMPSPGGGYTDFHYQYDPIGNMTYKSDVGTLNYGSSAGPHAVTYAAGFTYQYDANGNMISGKGKSFSYDIENRLISVDNGLGTESYTYDGDGRRVRKTRNDGGGTTSSTTYVGALFEKDSDGKVRKHIFAGTNRVCTVTKDDEGGTSDVSYYHSDHLGSSNVISNQNGQLVQYCEYTPYGALARNEGADVAKYKFTGKESDGTGLYFYGARYYNPELGRFLTADTFVQNPQDPQTLNRYAYVRNNPLKYIDPSGNFFWMVIGAFLAGAFIGGTVAAVSGGSWKDILQAAIMGGITGLFMLGGSFAAAGIVSLTGATGITATAIGAAMYAIAGAAAGATNALIYDLDIAQAASFGALTSFVSFVTPIPHLYGLFGLSADSAVLSIVDRIFNSAITGAALGAAYAGMTGGDIWQGAKMGAAAWAIGAAATMALGHLVGFIASGGRAPTFKNGMFMYHASNVPFTIGNVITGHPYYLTGTAHPSTQTVFEHEAAHGRQGILLGPAYLPLHLTSLSVGGVLGLVTGNGFMVGTHRYNMLERWWIDIPNYN